MKVKFNFSGAAIGQFFAANGEKFVLTITVLLLLWFIYGAITAKPLESDMPGRIKRESAQADTRIAEKQWKDRVAEEPGLAASAIAAPVPEGTEEVQLARLEHGFEWNPPLFRELIKRGDPEIYPALEVRAASGMGIVPYKAEGVAAAPGVPPVAQPPIRPAGPDFGYSEGAYGPRGPGGLGGPGGQAQVPSQAKIPGARMSGQGAVAKPKFFAVITGLVPLEKQVGEYKKRFEFAVRDPEGGTTGRTDDPFMPEYRFCRVERAELKDPRDPDLKWTAVDIKAAYHDISQWAIAAASTEIVDPEYIGPSQDTVGSLVAWPLPPLLLRDWGLEATHPKIPLVKPITEATGAETPTETEDAFAPGAARTGPGGDMRHMGAPPTYRHSPREVGPRGMMGQGHRDPSAPVPTYRLVRFVDLSAEPGKLYRYRVQLVVNNPNYGLHPQFLEKAESAKEGLRASLWSEPTAPVRIPSQAEVLAAGAVVRGDPNARIHIHALLAEPPVEVLAQKILDRDIDLPLGSVANFRDVTIPGVVDMAVDQVHDVGPVNLNASDSVLLDIRNDDPLGASARSKGPTEVLLMDASGRMYVANSATDAVAINDYKKRTEMPAPVVGEGDGMPSQHSPFGPQFGRPPPTRPRGGR